MPTTMKQLAVVQFFTWFALPCMWQYYGIAVARHVFLAPDEKSPLFAAGTEWGGLSFAVYNVGMFSRRVFAAADRQRNRPQADAFHLPDARRFGLALDIFCARQILFVGRYDRRRVRLGFDTFDAVRDLAGAIKPERMGVYMGVFNLFIVIPQIVMGLIVPQIYDNILGQRSAERRRARRGRDDHRRGQRFDRQRRRGGEH